MTIKHIRSVLILLTISASFICSCKVSKTVAQVAVPMAIDTIGSRKDSDKRNEFEYLFIEGIKQRTLGNPDEAIKIFSRCLELDPNSSATLYEMANIHISKGDFQSSMMLCEKAVSLNPENKYYHLLLVKIYLQNKLYDKAANEYKSLVQLFPDDVDYKFQLAATLSMTGKTTEALDIYNKLEAKMGLTEPIGLGKEQIFLAQGNRPAAYEEIEKLIKRYPTEPKYYGLIADLYLADKNREKALEYYNKILQIDPNDGFVHLSIANFYLENKEYQKAYDHIKLAFKNSMLDLETKAQMFLLLSQPGEGKITDKQQLELLNILITTHVDDERPRSLLVDYLLSKKQPEEARKQLRLVLDMKKDNYLYWERLLIIDNDLLDWKTLCTDGKTAIGYFPEQPLLYILDAVGLLQLKKYDELLALLDTGEGHANNDPKILSQFYTYRAEAYYNLKRFDDAFKMFDKVIAIDPQNYMAMNNYAYYLSLKSEKLDVAEKLSGQVIQANPDNSTYLDTYAWVLFKKKDFKLAKFYMESALSKNTEENAVLVEHYGDILFFLNEKQNAVAQWKKSLGMGNSSKVLKEKITKGIYIESNQF